MSLETKQNKKKTTSLSLKLYFSPGQSQLIGPPQPIVAIVGDDIVLPCHLDPAVDAFDMIVEWTRPDLDHRLVLLWRHGWELEHKNHLSYEGRTSLFMEKLKNGDVSLKLSEVKLSDEGKYRCFIPSLDRESIVELVVGAASSPVIIMHNSSSGVVLECESKGWYPEPELFWLDAEGKLLSAGAPETVRDFFFVYIYDSPALYVAIVFAVIFVFMSILAVLFVLHKRRENKITVGCAFHACLFTALTCSSFSILLFFYLLLLLLLLLFNVFGLPLAFLRFMSQQND
uniref:Ig-like domain-containing protein n=1 Tax=Myripristis murdjan TaxID=586833 RepID=A0A667Z6C2_9TELE